MSSGPQDEADKELVNYEELDAEGNVVSWGACPRYIVRYLREVKGQNIRIKEEEG